MYNKRSATSWSALVFFLCSPFFTFLLAISEWKHPEAENLPWSHLRPLHMCWILHQIQWQCAMDVNAGPMEPQIKPNTCEHTPTDWLRLLESSDTQALFERDIRLSPHCLYLPLLRSRSRGTKFCFRLLTETNGIDYNGLRSQCLSIWWKMYAACRVYFLSDGRNYRIDPWTVVWTKPNGGRFSATGCNNVSSHCRQISGKWWAVPHKGPHSQNSIQSYNFIHFQIFPE